MWLYKSYQEFSLEAAGITTAEQIINIRSGGRTEIFPDAKKGPPVIVAEDGKVQLPYPMLEGRHRQSLPRIPGRLRGQLLAGNTKSEMMHGESLEAWLVPWRVGADRTIVITVTPGTILIVNVEDWPEPHAGHISDTRSRSRERTVRRAARILDATPSVFATEPSIKAVYGRLEKIWNDPRLGDDDPKGELLVKHARRLQVTLEDLSTRPRVVLRNEHRMLKLQTVRRTDAKTLRWLSSQPGRNIAERAGSRQRIRAPKRYETIATLENRVLRSFAALTVRETKNWIENTDNRVSDHYATIEAHHRRAVRVEAILREHKVPEAKPPIQPNFPLRFDPHYRKIWRSWLELRARSAATELEWMWQHRTFMELLGLRAAMKLRQIACDQPDGGILAHAPVLRVENAPNKGSYLNDTGIQIAFGIDRDDLVEELLFRTRDIGSGCLGAIAHAGLEASIWWHAQFPQSEGQGAVGELPWSDEHDWDTELQKWAVRIMR